MQDAELVSGAWRQESKDQCEQQLSHSITLSTFPVFLIIWCELFFNRQEAV
jgi:hypothetical protein